MRRFTDWSNWRTGSAGLTLESTRRPQRRNRRCGRSLRVESLEGRSLLSATVTSVGTATDYSIVNSNVSVTAAAAVPVGDRLIVEVASDPTGGAVTVSDTRGNVYSIDANVTNSGDVETWIFSAPVTHALSAGDHVTVHFAGVAPLFFPPNAKAVSVLDANGLEPTSPLDRTHTQAGGTSPVDSGTTLTTHHPQELIIGALGIEGPNTDSFSPNDSLALIGRAGTNTGPSTSNVTIDPVYRNVSATGNYGASGAISPSRQWAAAVATYVIDTAPVVTPTADQTNNEHDTVSLPIVASDSDGDPLSYSAVGLPTGLSINASTGVITGTIAGSAANQPPFNVDVSVSDGTTTVHDLFTWTVHNVAPIVTGHDISTAEGVTTGPVTVATFTDIGGPEPIGNYTATINWGDGTTTSGVVSESGGTFTVQGTHAYAEESTPDHTGGGAFYVVKVTVDDNNGISTVTGSATAHATVSDPAVTPTGGFTVSATEGVSSGNQTVATFVDPAGAEVVGDYSADVDWGDGTTTTGTITETGGTFTVQGSHTYAEQTGSPFPVTVTIHHEAAPDATAISSASVVEDGFAVTGVAVSGFELSALSNVAVATFTHAGGSEPAGDFTATINWGDGTSSTGTVTLSGGIYTVSGSHTYTDENSFPVTVDIGDINTASTATATASTTAAILEQLLPDGTRGTANQRFISEVYRDLLGRQVDPDGLAHWDALLAGGQTRQQIVLGIEQTPEYVDLTVNNIYERYLHRDAGNSGLQHFAALSFQGATDEQISAAVIGSDEYFVTQGGGTNEGFVNAMYEYALGRPVDPEGLAFWLSQLAGGMTRTQVAAQVLASPEYRDDLVSQAYAQLLDRSADSGGLNGFVTFMDAGASDQQVYAGICGSPEYFNKTVA